MWTKRAKTRPNLFSYSVSLAFLYIAQVDSLTSRGKTDKKTFGAQNCARNQGFCHFLKFASLLFLDIVQDCSLGQCLTSSRDRTSKITICGLTQDLIGQNQGRNGLFYSNVVECPGKLACLFRKLFCHEKQLITSNIINFFEQHAGLALVDLCHKRFSTRHRCLKIAFLKVFRVNTP